MTTRARAAGVAATLLLLCFIKVLGLMAAPRTGGGAELRRRVAFERMEAASSSSSPATARVYHVTSYGADPTGKNDSTAAIARAIDDAFRSPATGHLMPEIPDLGGAEVHLDGGTYLVSSPVRLRSSKGGNFRLHGGSLKASDDFPATGYVVELRASPPPPTSSAAGNDVYDYEYVTLRDLKIDAGLRGGGIAVVNSLRTTITDCYVVGFATDGIWVHGGHETYISGSFLGQHITAGGDPGERGFSGTAINLAGNDNSVSDVVVFSAGVGVLVSGQANTLSNVHCYNKATGFGGTGIYLKTPGLTQTRIVNCYLDYTSIVAEDPVQLHVSGSFFYGGATVVLKSVRGKMRGVTVAHNMFSAPDGGSGGDIIVLDESARPFTDVKQVVVVGNTVDGMRLRSTEAKGVATAVASGGRRWEVDFSPVLLFADRIKQVQYTMAPAAAASGFPSSALRNVSGNRVVIEADDGSPATASFFVTVDQN